MENSVTITASFLLASLLMKEGKVTYIQIGGGFATKNWTIFLSLFLI